MNISIVGASGAVGQELLQVLQQRNFPVRQLRLFGSERSAGQTYTFRNNPVVVERLQHGDLFSDTHIVFTSAGAAVSREYADDITRHGAIMIDNSSAFRMCDDVPERCAATPTQHYCQPQLHHHHDGHSTHADRATVAHTTHTRCQLSERKRSRSTGHERGGTTVCRHRTGKTTTHTAISTPTGLQRHTTG